MLLIPSLSKPCGPPPTHRIAVTELVVQVPNSNCTKAEVLQYKPGASDHNQNHARHGFESTHSIIIPKNPRAPTQSERGPSYRTKFMIVMKSGHRRQEAKAAALQP